MPSIQSKILHRITRATEEKLPTTDEGWHKHCSEVKGLQLDEGETFTEDCMIIEDNLTPKQKNSMGTAAMGDNKTVEYLIVCLIVVVIIILVAFLVKKFRSRGSY